MPARIFPDNSDWAPPLGPTEKDACGTTNEDGTFSNSWMLDGDDDPEFEKSCIISSMNEAIKNGLDPDVARAMHPTDGSLPDYNSPAGVAFSEWLEKRCPRALMIAEGLLDPD